MWPLWFWYIFSRRRYLPWKGLWLTNYPQCHSIPIHPLIQPVRHPIPFPLCHIQARPKSYVIVVNLKFLLTSSWKWISEKTMPMMSAIEPTMPIRYTFHRGRGFLFGTEMKHWNYRFDHDVPLIRARRVCSDFSRCSNILAYKNFIHLFHYSWFIFCFLSECKSRLNQQTDTLRCSRLCTNVFFAVFRRIATRK